MRTGIRLTTKRAINHSSVVIVITIILLYLFYARTADLYAISRDTLVVPAERHPKLNYTSMAPKMIMLHVIFSQYYEA